MAIIGEQILTARKAKGWTQDTLAEALNVSRSSVANWECGRRMPDGETLLRLSKILNYNFEAESAAEILVNERQNAEQLVSVSSSNDTQSENHALQSEAKSAYSKKKHYLILSVALSVAVLAVCLFFVLREKQERVYTADDGNSFAISQFQQPTKKVEGKAYLRLEPSVQITEGDNYNYWMYGMKMYEENGIALTVDRVEEYIFGEKNLVQRTYGSGDIQAYGVSLDIAPYGEWWFGGGFPVQNVKGLGMKIYCTDENGASLCFVGYLPLSEK